MLLAETSVVFDPTWPWSLPGIGLPLLAGVALLLIGLTVWTYLGARGSNFRRILCVLLLRLGALLVACFLVLRPCLAEQDDENALPSKLLVLVDKSESMNFTDESFDLSRWGYACRILDHAGAILMHRSRASRCGHRAIAPPATVWLSDQAVSLGQPSGTPRSSHLRRVPYRAPPRFARACLLFFL